MTMQDWLVDLAFGVLCGGLAVSACWGLFWLAVGTVGFSRGTSTMRVLLNSVTVTIMPLLFMLLLMWLRGPSRQQGLAFGTGLAVVPLVLVGLGLRRAPDGRRAGAHMLGGIRHLMDELLGKHHGCGGCDHEHDHGGCG